jgi:WD40 repeat protein
MPDYTPLTKINEAVTKLAFSTDGNRLAVAASREPIARVWDLVDRVELCTIKAEPEACGFAFGLDNKTLYLATGKGTVQVWDTDNEKMTGEFEVKGVQGIACSPDGTTLATADAWDYAVKTWDAATLQLKLTLETKEQMCAVAFSADGKTLGACGGSGKIALFLAARGKAKAAPGPLGGDGALRCLAFSPDGNFLALGGDSVRLIDLSAGGDRVGFKAPVSEASGVMFTADGARLLFAKNKLIVADAVTGGVVKEIEVGHGIRALAMTPGGKKLATGDASGNVCIWDPATLN